MTYGRMIVGVSIINRHIFKKPLDVLVEEALNFSVLEFRVNKEGTDVRLHNIRKSLKTFISAKRSMRMVEVGYLWSCLCQSPIIASAIGVFLHFFEILHVFAILTLDCCAVRSKMLVQAELYSHCCQEFVRYHGHLRPVSQGSSHTSFRASNLVLCQPLGVSVRIPVEQEADRSRIEQSITQEFKSLVAGDSLFRKRIRRVYESRS